MPLPMPSGAHDTEKKWMDACMGHPKMNGEYPDAEQRSAVCHGQWDKHMKGQTAHAYGHLALVAGSSDVGGLKRIMLTPWGEVKSRNQDFVVDDESAAEIVAAFDAGGRDIPIDFEHTTVGGNFATPSGAAPAAGWITKIVVEKGIGIFGLVKWNTAAAAMILADEYRWLSPVMVYRKKDRKAVEIQSAALTNKPALIDMERVAAKDAGDRDGDDTMDTKKLRAALLAAGVKLADDADDGAVIAASKAFVEAAAKQPEAPSLEPIASKLGLAKDSTIATIAAKLDTFQKESVPAVEYKAMADRLLAIETRDKDRESQTLVAKAIEDAKLNPHDAKQMDWARAYAKSDPVGFGKWSDVATTIHSTTRIIKPSPNLDGGDDRATVIVAAKEEFKSASSRLRGLRQDTWINGELRDKNMALLSAEEKKAL